ncbi:MAG: biosynthetic-type acetolactate synthase large subunit [Acidaminococcales bacterium]|jgi:acetolactate synthase-1/2/3 large subunit|nr:biosynthetic-type acetolactate synthase large subunit [Acidaminococcales bacterium]
MQMSGANIILRCLEEQGVDKVFGYPGGAILPFYDALAGSKTIEHILTVHEQGAAHAADGYARGSGRVGVCIATSGPGATNLITGLATAFMDSIPVVAITGQVARNLIGRDAFQEVDITGISMPVTKHNFLVKNPKHLAGTIRLAFDIAKSGRPGPVLVDVPRDIQVMPIEYVPGEGKNRDVAFERQCGNDDIDAAAAAIKNARRPLLLTGGGAVAAEVQPELVELAEKINMPVGSTLMGLGAFPGEHRLFLGMTGLHGLERANNAVQAADVLLAVGSRFNDRVTGDPKAYTEKKTVIHVDVDPAEIDKNVFAGIGLAGNMKCCLRKLCARISGKTPQSWWNSINEWPGVDESFRGTAAPLFVRALDDAARGRDVIIVTDVGQHQMWVAQHIRIARPRNWITSGGQGCMGFGLPAAIGAQFSRPGSRVVVVSGDGGFKMTGNELYTIARHKLPIVSVLFNNDGLGMIRQLQQVLFEGRRFSCELPPIMDFIAYAGAFGIKGERADTAEKFAAALDGALAADEPRFIEAVIKPSDMVKPMVNIGGGLNSYVKFPLPPE